MVTQPSMNSLSRYASARAPGLDIYNGSSSRDFCNAFWGLGDAGVNVLFTRMRGAIKTTEELAEFWKERTIIEEEYANRLAGLAKISLGSEEIGELRASLDALRAETDKQAAGHTQLASQLRSEMETHTAHLLAKQQEHKRAVQAPIEKKFKEKQSQESYVAKAREKYEGDCVRIASYTQQILQGRDAERLQPKLKRAQQTVQANEKDFANFTKKLADLMPQWQEDWKQFCDSCQDMEEGRLEFMKDVLWTYANAVSTVCVSDDQSCEDVRTALDHLEPTKDVLNFVEEYGTGNLIPDPPVFVSYAGQTTTSPVSTPSVQPANFVRVTDRPPVEAAGVGEQLSSVIEIAAAPPPPPEPQLTQAQREAQQWKAANGSAGSSSQSHENGAGSSSQTPAYSANAPVVEYRPPPPPEVIAVPNAQPPTRQPSRRVNLPTPAAPSQSGETPIAQDYTPEAGSSSGGGGGSGGGVLFYVKALYDYTATIDEEFDFQAGDVIAVTATPDDGWWSGELLDEARREEGRHVFPSNFVCLF